MWSDAQKRFAATRRMERKGLWRYLNVNEGTAAELAKEFAALKQAQKYTCKTKGLHPQGGMCGLFISSDKICGAHPNTECHNKLKKSDAIKYAKQSLDGWTPVDHLCGASILLASFIRTNIDESSFPPEIEEAMQVIDEWSMD